MRHTSLFFLPLSLLLALVLLLETTAPTYAAEEVEAIESRKIRWGMSDVEAAKMELALGSADFTFSGTRLGVEGLTILSMNCEVCYFFEEDKLNMLMFIFYPGKFEKTEKLLAQLGTVLDKQFAGCESEDQVLPVEKGLPGRGYDLPETVVIFWGEKDVPRYLSLTDEIVPYSVSLMYLDKDFFTKRKQGNAQREQFERSGK